MHPATHAITAPVSEDAAASPHVAAAQKMQALRSAIVQHPSATIQGALLPLLDAAENDAALVRKNVESWYNSVMDRVSGWYKRRTQIIIAVISLGLAVLFNADAIAVARYFGTNQTARAVMVARAQQEIQKETGPPTPDLGTPMSWLQDQGGVPLGWRFAKGPHQSPADYAADWRQVPSTPETWLLKVAGLLCTMFALSLGAPFWFDVLNRFMVVRSTVKPQEKSRDEPSKS